MRARTLGAGAPSWMESAAALMVLICPCSSVYIVASWARIASFSAVRVASCAACCSVRVARAAALASWIFTASLWACLSWASMRSHGCGSGGAGSSLPSSAGC